MASMPNRTTRGGTIDEAYPAFDGFWERRFGRIVSS